MRGERRRRREPRRTAASRSGGGEGDASPQAPGGGGRGPQPWRRPVRDGEARRPAGSARSPPSSLLLLLQVGPGAEARSQAQLAAAAQEPLPAAAVPPTQEPDPTVCAGVFFFGSRRARVRESQNCARMNSGHLVVFLLALLLAGAL